MRTHDQGVLEGRHKVELCTILDMPQDGLHSWPFEAWERVECFRILSVPTAPILAYYTSVVINDYSWATAVWYVASLETVVLALRRFILVAEGSAGGTTVGIPVWVVVVVAA